MILLIVESPTKSKKLKQLLGDRYRIAASFGHVRDLPQSGDLAVHFDQGRVEPNYQPIERSARAIAELRQLAGRAERVILATDPDREGEAIAWHVAELLGLDERAERVAFNAITKRAVEQALAEPRAIDQRLVGAQQARRVLDRVVGWAVSPTLRRGLRDRAAKSAGRVQSVALRLVAERERAIADFRAVDYFVLSARLSHAEKPPPFTAQLVEWKGAPLEHRLQDQALAEATVQWCQRQDWIVDQVDRREQRRQPPPPFVTATAQQAASVQLKYAPQRTMQLLQKLFENGHITYHRTDSVAVEPEAIAAARAVIAKRYPAEYLPDKPIAHAGKAANTQEAHEAIRPTHPESGPKAVGDDEAGKLYKLIWQRFIASQMAAGRDFLTTITVAVAPGAWQDQRRGRLPMGRFRAKGKVVLFDGWRRLTKADAADEKSRLRKKKGDEEEVAELPPVEPGDPLRLDQLEAIKKSTKAPARYTQASLIKKLEQRGVGRPSTSSAILTTILARSYVEEKRRKLHATDLGLRVTDYLCRAFAGNFIDSDFTAQMEQTLDRIDAGEADWQAAVTEAAATVAQLAQRAGLPYDPLVGPPPPPSGSMDCPLCRQPMRPRTGPYGPFFACSDGQCGAICNPDGSPNAKTRKRLDEHRGPGST
mgnify:CR=1 FL=1